ncbi:MAG TPA: hypothetical protein VJQ77_06950 [Novosphingobium sp.]|nr:hypothetical protein [Novosphingobium sp.]
MKLPLAVTVAGLAFLAGCKSTPDFPPRSDVEAATETKPVPPTTILTDPTASDRYNAELESWGERVQSAGVKLCRYFKARGMAVDCPEPAGSAAN